MSDAMRQLQEFLRRNRASSPSCTGQDQRHESIITKRTKVVRDILCISCLNHVLDAWHRRAFSSLRSNIVFCLTVQLS